MNKDTKRNQNEEDDGFWKIALDTERRSSDMPLDQQNDSSDEADCSGSIGKCISYELQIANGELVVLKLHSLPPTEGIWSPLGADAWFGSALLSAILLQPESPIQAHLDRVLSSGHESLSCLELGSGAVGLSGLALGLLLAQQRPSPPGRHDRHRLCLTDNESHVLKQLAYNVESTVKRLEIEHCDLLLPEITVKPLDWNNGHSIDNDDSFGHHLDLCIGSELVYTPETADACATVVRSLLHQHANLLIAIVQVTDRDGFRNVFLPSLRQDVNLLVVEEALVDAHLHETASRMIRHNGTFDQLDFGVCYISNKQTK